jgi:two-component system chemotaxis response regulator CheY
MSALEHYFVSRPDVVVLDLVMKGMYGLDVLAKLREMDQSVKVIVVTADVQTSSQRLVNDAGASGFLVKPLEADQILPLIRTTLEGDGKVQLSPVQHDALVELLNIGFGRAGASLSSLTDIGCFLKSRTWPFIPSTSSIPRSPSTCLVTSRACTRSSADRWAATRCCCSIRSPPPR